MANNQRRLVAHLIGWAHQYFNKLINFPKKLTYHHYHHHHHHQSVLPKGRYFIANSGTKAAVLPKGRPSTANSETKVVVLQVWRLCLLYLFFSVKERKNTFTLLLKCWMTSHKTHPQDDQTHPSTKETERNTRGPAHNHTQKLNRILVEEQIYVQYSCSRPLHHIFHMGALLAWPTVARDGKRIYLIMEIYWCSSR